MIGAHLEYMRKKSSQRGAQKLRKNGPQAKLQTYAKDQKWELTAYSANTNKSSNLDETERTEKVEHLQGRIDIVYEHFKELFTDPSHAEVPQWIW